MIVRVTVALGVLALAAVAHARVSNDPATVLPVGSHINDLQLAFDDSPSAKRHFDECHWHKGDPYLTLGFGHFAKSCCQEFIHRIWNDYAAREQMLGAYAKEMDRQGLWTSSDWKAVGGKTPPTTMHDKIDALDTVFRKYFKSASKLKSFGNKYKTRLNKSDNWMNAGWKVASRIEAVARAAIMHWTEGCVVGPAQKVANEANIKSFGGKAAMASWKSSGGFWRYASSYSGSRSMSLPAVKKEDCADSYSDDEDIDAVSFTWNMDTPPAACVGEADATDPRFLRDYKALRVWQLYMASKGKDARTPRKDSDAWPKCKDAKKYLTKNRYRMNSIWEQWYVQAWGATKPNSPTQCLPHTGVYMDEGDFGVNPYELRMRDEFERRHMAGRIKLEDPYNLLTHDWRTIVWNGAGKTSMNRMWGFVHTSHAVVRSGPPSDQDAEDLGYAYQYQPVVQYQNTKGGVEITPYLDALDYVWVKVRNPLRKWDNAKKQPVAAWMRSEDLTHMGDLKKKGVY